MKEENRQYAALAYDIVKHASEDIGSRLPGSEGERKFASYMGDKLKEIGIKPVKEEFAVSPMSSIGGLPLIGKMGFILSVLCYFAIGINALWFGIAIASVVTWVWIICSVFLYRTWFDMFFKHKISQNTYGELVPEDGEYDYTIILSGHTDTSWNWRHSEHIYKYRNKPIIGVIATYGKVGFAAVCFFLITAIAIFNCVIATGSYFQAPWLQALAYNQSFMQFYTVFQYAMYFIPAVTGIGCLFLKMWGTPEEENASRGAMDNATGCALSYAVIKYFKDNPEKLPPRCRIIDFNCGSEEAGLRGSIAFTRQHKGEPILENAYNLNIDSIADEEYFEVVIKDDWQFTRFDKDLEKMFKDSFAELGIESKTGGCIHNPVGGCDSTPMTKAGIKSVTFAAQNPMLTYYYHTFRDTADRFTEDTVGTGFDVLLSVIDKIAAFQEANGYNGPQK